MKYLMYLDIIGRKGGHVYCECEVSDESFGYEYPFEFVLPFSDGETRFVRILRPCMNTKISRKRCVKIFQALWGVPRNMAQELVSWGLLNHGSYFDVLRHLFFFLLTVGSPGVQIPVEYLVEEA